jgi:DNA mismatch repair protein MutS
MRDTTPMMGQYRALKAKHGDALLFFRLGDFYELFYEDAEVGSRELGIALTGRDAGNGERAPMCGVPHHSVDDYIRVLVDKGYRVALCDQLEDPALAKGLVKRDVTRVITPGTYWEGAEAGAPSYIASIVTLPAGSTGGSGQVLARSEGAQEAGICACDLSTGEVLLACFQGEAGGPAGVSKRGGARDRAAEELARFLPRECVIPAGSRSGDLKSAVERSVPGIFVTAVPEDDFKRAAGADGESAASRVYGPEVVRGFFEEGRLPALAALQGLLSYLTSTQMTDLHHLKKPVFYLDEGFVEVDRSTRRNLELLERLLGGREGSLCWSSTGAARPWVRGC